MISNEWPSQWIISEGERRQPARKILAARLPHISKIKLDKLMAAGNVFVDGVPITATYRGIVGQSLKIAIEFAPISALLPEDLPLKVIAQDNELIVIDKPAGMLVHPSASQKSGTLLNAVSFLLQKTGQLNVRPGLAHRLDRQTSGLIVLAKTPRALRVLSRQFSRQQVEKTYFAIVIGQPTAATGVIEAPIGYALDQFPHWQVCESGKPAVTHFRWLKTFPWGATNSAVFSLLELTPKTGRTNQIRVHCAAVGLPIVQDYLYGRAANETIFGQWQAAPTNSRHLLHAAALKFRHPQTNETVEFHSSLPTDIETVIGGVRSCAFRREG